MWSGDFEFIITSQNIEISQKYQQKQIFAKFLKVFIKSRNLSILRT